MVRSSRVEVYTRQVNAGGGGPHQDTFACRVSTKRSLAFSLPSIPDIEVPRPTVKISGLFAAAYVIEGTGKSVGYSVRVIDLHPSRPRLGFNGTASKSDFGNRVPNLVLNSHGAVAWILQPLKSNGKSGPYEVRGAGTNHAPRLFDSSTRIDKRSLRLTGSTLTWSDAGRTRSASLT